MTTSTLFNPGSDGLPVIDNQPLFLKDIMSPVPAKFVQTTAEVIMPHVLQAFEQEHTVTIASDCYATLDEVSLRITVGSVRPQHADAEPEYILIAPLNGGFAQ